MNPGRRRLGTAVPREDPVAVGVFRKPERGNVTKKKKTPLSEGRSGRRGADPQEAETMGNVLGRNSGDERPAENLWRAHRNLRDPFPLFLFSRLDRFSLVSACQAVTRP